MSVMSGPKPNSINCPQLMYTLNIYPCHWQTESLDHCKYLIRIELNFPMIWLWYISIRIYTHVHYKCNNTFYACIDLSVIAIVIAFCLVWMDSCKELGCVHSSFWSLTAKFTRQVSNWLYLVTVKFTTLFVCSYNRTVNSKTFRDER